MSQLCKILKKKKKSGKFYQWYLITIKKIIIVDIILHLIYMTILFTELFLDSGEINFEYYS